MVGAGQVKCWGGGLGSGEYVTRPANVPLPPGSVALQVAAGGDSGAGESCALLASGAVSCWGGPVRYPGGEPTYIPVTLPFGAGVVVTQISMGSEAGCAVIAGGGVKCWPLYWPSQIGNGSANPIGPVDVLLGLAANQVSVGWQHACATLVNGTVKCWGTIGNQAVLPDVGQAPLGPGAVVEQVATYGNLSCARLTTGQVKCWSRTPLPAGPAVRDVPFALGEQATQISMGAEACAVLTSGTLQCWGLDRSNFPVSPLLPHTVLLGAGIKAAQSAAGGYHSCVSTTDGAVRCWGRNALGSIGNGTTNDSLIPLVAVAPLTAAPLQRPTIISLPPARLLDSRPKTKTVDGAFAQIGIRDAGSITELQVLGRAGVPNDAKAVVLNVTVTGPQADGFVTVFPCGTQRPIASNVNFTAGATIPNLVVAKTGMAGRVCLFTFATTHLIADVNGFVPATSTFVPLEPVRLLDTRQDSADADSSPNSGLRSARSITRLTVVGRGGIPLDASAGSFNVTVTDAEATGFITVFPCGAELPVASNLNFVAADPIANAVTVKIGELGQICLYTSAAAHFIVDVNGAFPTDASFVPSSPGRLVDTRQFVNTVDVRYRGNGPLIANNLYAFQIAGLHGVQPEATAASLNITATDTEAAGFVTVFPCSDGYPNASSLNFAAGQTIANAVIVKLDPVGTICVVTSARLNLIVDVNGYFPPSQ